MYKLPKNPKIEELSKSCKDRRINLSDLDIIKIEGKKFCVWCYDTPLKGRQYKWCSPQCSTSAFAWANPQKEEGLCVLLIRQDWKCNTCELTWKGMALEIHRELYKKYSLYNQYPALGDKLDRRLIKRLKYRCQEKHRPEVDHIIPIYKGGQAIGFDNHQIICYLCHKKKTGQDLSGKRKK